MIVSITIHCWIMVAMSIIQLLQMKTTLLKMTFCHIHSRSSIYNLVQNYEKKLEQNNDVVDKSPHYNMLLMKKLSGACLKEVKHKSEYCSSKLKLNQY